MLLYGASLLDRCFFFHKSLFLCDLLRVSGDSYQEQHKEAWSQDGDHH